MHPRIWILPTLGLLSALLLSGCSAWLTAGPQDPGVHLVKVEVVKARLLEQRFNLSFRIDNPNDTDLTVRGLRFRLLLEDMLLSEDRSTQWLTVPAHSQGYFTVPVRTNLWRHASSVVKRLEKFDQPMHYRLEGTLETGLFIGYDVHVMRNGEIIPGDLIPE